MPLEFQSPLQHPRGSIAALLDACYAELTADGSEIWRREVDAWKRYDDEVYENPDTIGACAFLTVFEGGNIGFGSWDPTGLPKVGLVGHNCILPEVRGRGFGSRQVREVLRRLRRAGALCARVLTMDHPFFVPAQRNYLACGFTETRRFLWERSPRYRVVEYQIDLSTSPAK